jgi:hypothetical protein
MKHPFQEQLRNDAVAWQKFNEIDMKDFMNQTSTDVNLIECMIDNVNCTRWWTEKYTYLGKCLQLGSGISKKRSDRSVSIESDHFFRYDLIKIVVVFINPIRYAF